MQSPRIKSKVHTHDCDNCTYLFSFNDRIQCYRYYTPYREIDVYVCGDLTDKNNHTLIARYGSEGREYASMNPSYLRNRKPDAESTLLSRAAMLWFMYDPLDNYWISADADDLED